jgi:hypothetical protein
LKDDLFVEPPGQEQDLLAGLDALLRASSIEDQFVWDAGIMGAFSKEQFWFLYRHIQLTVEVHMAKFFIRARAMMEPPGF